MSNELLEERARAIEQALSRIGQPISEEEARRLPRRASSASAGRACSRLRQPAGKCSAARASSPQWG